MAAPTAAFLTLQVSATVQMGEAVYLTGAAPSMGSWDLSSAVQLVTTPERFPVWYTPSPLPVTARKRVEYKYMIYSGGRFQRWENLDGNRVTAETPDAGATAAQPLDTLDVAPGAAVAETGAPAAASDEAVGGPDSKPAAAALEEHTTETPQPAPARSSHGGSPSTSPRISGPRSGHSATGPDGQSVTGGSPATAARDHHRSRFELAHNDGVIICCLRLPARVRKDASTGKWTASWDPEHLLARKRASFADALRVQYVGLAVADEAILPSDQAEVEGVLAQFHCYPVFINPSTRRQFERGFCRDTLWGIMHNVVDVFGRRPTRWWTRDNQEDRWQAYSVVNQAFTDKVVQRYSAGDLVWAHGHHLLLMPQFIARRIRKATPSVGLFLHAPFPSSEIFRSLSCRQDLLRGMLLSGQLGFHLFEYARHFSTSCRRILSLHESDDAAERDRGHPGSQIIEYQGRNVSLTVSHAGIEPTVFARDVRSATARRESAQLRAILVDRDLDELERARRMMPRPPEEVCSRAVAAKAREVAQEADALSYGAISRSDDVPLLAAVLASLPAAPGPAVPLPVGPDGRPPARDPRSRRAPAWGPLPRAEAAAAAAAAAAAPAAPAGTAPVTPLAGVAGPSAEDTWLPAKEPAADPWADGTRRLAVGVETLSRLDAIPLKLCAWEALLRRCPHWVGRVALVQVCVADADATEESDAVLSEARHIAARTNAAFSVGCDGRSFPPVILVERSAPLPARSRAALFAAADVLVSLPLRAGFVPAPLEYVWAAAPEGRGAYAPIGVDPCLVQGPDGRLPLPAELDALRGGRPGVAVLSEFMAGSRVLCGALRVNPWKIDEVVAAMAIALGMPGSERVARWESSASFVGNCSTADWAERVLTDLKRNASVVGRRAVVTMGLGYTYRNVNFGSTFRKLQTANVLRAFRHSHRRVIFTDYGGTLHTRDVAEARRRALARGKLLGRDDAPPITPETFAALKQLSTDPRTVVFVISGKERHVLDKAFEDLPDVGLAAEHGFFFRWPAKLSARAAAGQTGRWHRLLSRFDDSWLDLALSIMELYTARTNGTFILRKGSAIAWHFGDADAEFGSMQAKELKDHLGGVMGTMPVEVVSGLNYIEVRPRDVHKGAIAIHVLSRLERVLGGMGDASALAPAGFGGVPGVAVLPSPAPQSVSGMSLPRKSASRGIFGVISGPAPSTPMSGGSSGTLGTMPIMDEGGACDDATASQGMPAESGLAPPHSSGFHHGQRVASAASRLASCADSPALPHAAGASGAGWGQDDSYLGRRGDTTTRRPEMFRGASDGVAVAGASTRPRGRSSAGSSGLVVGDRCFPQRVSNIPVTPSSREAPPPSPFVGAMSSTFLSGAAPMLSPHMGPQAAPLLGASTTRFRRAGPGSAGSSGCLEGADPVPISRTRVPASGAVAGHGAAAADASAGAGAGTGAGSGARADATPTSAAGRAATSGRVIDFVLAAGDDTSDELMFTALNDWRKWGDGAAHHGMLARGASEPPRALERPSAADGAAPTAPASRHAHLGHVEMARRAVSTQVGTPHGRSPAGLRAPAEATHVAKAPSHHRNVFTITVGQKPSRAHTFVDDTQAVEDLYTALARLSARSAPNRSMVDLRAAGTASRRGRPAPALHYSPKSPPLQPHTSPAGLDLGLSDGGDPPAPGTGPSLPGQSVLTAWPDRRIRSNSAASSESASSLHNAAVAGALMVSDRHAGSFAATGLAFPSSPPLPPNMDAASRSRSVVDMSLGLFPHSSAPHSGASTPMLPPLGRASAAQPSLLESLRQHASTGASTFPVASSGGTGVPQDVTSASLGAGGAGLGSTAPTPPDAAWDRQPTQGTTPISAGMQWLSQVALTAGIGVPHSNPTSTPGTPTGAAAAGRPGSASALARTAAIARPSSHRQLDDGRHRPSVHSMPRSLSGNIQSYFRSVEAQPEDEPMEF